MKHDLLSPVDAERRSHLIYSFYRPNSPITKKETLAQKSGYSPEYIARLFSGERRVSDEAAKNLAISLGVREEYLLGKDDYMTLEDYQKIMQQADSLASAINQCALTNHFYYTGADPTDIPEDKSFDEKTRTFISTAHNIKQRSLINLADQYYIDITDEEYKTLCDDISEYIQFKLQQLYNHHSKHHIKK